MRSVAYQDRTLYLPSVKPRWRRPPDALYTERLSVNTLFLLIGGIIFLGIAGSYLFEKTRIPDVLILMGLGFILGPMLGLVNPATIKIISPCFGTLALVVILFEGGMGLDLRQLISQFAPATFLTFFTFAGTMAGVAVLAHLSIGISWIAASLLGAILGAAPSPSISIPVVARMKIPEKTKTLMILESGLTDVLAVVVAFGVDGCRFGGANTNRWPHTGQASTSVFGGRLAGVFSRICLAKDFELVWAPSSVIHHDARSHSASLQWRGGPRRLRRHRGSRLRHCHGERRTALSPL